MQRIYFLAFLLIPLLSFSQNSSLSGTIIDESTNIPLIGATIIVQGTNNGVTSDFDGNFTINNVKVGDVIEVSFLGFVTQSISIKDFNSKVILMEEDAASLEQVLVIGYGSQKRKEITGAVAVIGKQTIEDLKPQRIEQAIQGQVAGVQITSNSGAPGSGLNINIRGISTNGDNRPLILLDGSRIEDLSVVNPADIESINVLKDATAGIYGVQAANGVIIITSKKGQRGSGLKVDFSSYYGIQETTRKIPVLNATEYGLLVNEARANGGQGPLFTNIASLGQGTDWQDEVFEAAPVFNAAVTVGGGGEKSRYTFGASYLTQDGIVGGDKANFERITARVGYNVDILDNLKFNSSMLYTGTVRSGVLENTIGSILYNALNNAPTFAIRDEAGAFTLAEGLGNEVINPLAQLENTYNEGTVDRISGSFGLSYDFLEHFKVETRFQANYADVDGFSFSPTAFYGSGKVFNIARSSVVESKSIFKDYIFDAFATYQRTFKENHNLTVLLGNSISQTVGSFSGFTGFDIENNSVANASISQANDVVNNFPNGNASFDSRLLSYFTRVQYDYKGKYLFSGLARRDGSTKFGPRNKFGFFPSASVGWIASDESFLEDSSSINFLKLRASYGIIGNDRIADFGFESSLNGEGVYVINDALVFGSAVGTISNPEIKWEEQKTFDIGVDARFMDNALNVTVDYFNRRTEDLLVTAPVSGILGASAPGSGPPIVNAGTVVNKGFELSIGYNHEFSDDFRMNASFNLTTIDNEVVFVNSENAFIPGGSFGVGQDFPARMEAGFPIGYFRGYKTQGIFQTQADVDGHATQMNAVPGDIRFVDVNGDGSITVDDQTNIGDPIPDATFGMNFSIDYKNFDFLVYAFASVGNDIVRNYERFQQLTNRSKSFLDRWTGPGTSTSSPRVTTAATSNTQFSEFFVEDGSFIRIQNIQFGYTLPDAFSKKLKLDSFRVYTSVTNAFTFTKYKGYDPTASSGSPIGAGIDNGFYPTPRTFLVGLNVKL